MMGIRTSKHDFLLMRVRYQSILGVLGIVALVNGAATESHASFLGRLFSGSKSPYLEIETPGSCGGDRNYLLSDIETMKSNPQTAQLVQSRKESTDPEVAPKACVAFSMNYFSRKLLDAVDKDSLNFGYCGTQSGYPIRKNRAPCVTEDYVNLVYNAFQDVTDCMGIPQKLVLPKLLNESGFHINAMAPLRALDAEGKIIKTVLTPPFTEEQKKGRIIGGDAGVGQLTGSALRDINATINDWTVYINGSEKASCQRLKTYLGKIPSQENVHPEVENRCSLMSMPQNPVYSFILWGVLFNNNQASIRYAWKENNIAGLLEKNGFSATEEQMKRMRESLIILSYNAGPRLSLTLFKNWLESRVAQPNQVAIKREDFDLSQNGSSASIRVRPNDEAKTVASLSPDEVESLTKEYANLIAKKEKQSSRAKAIAALGLDRLPFSVYLRIYRTGWSKGYLTYIKSFADTANNEVGKGVCVHEHFLSL